MTDTGATPQSAEDRPGATAPSLVVALAWTAAAGLGVPLGLWLSGPTDGSDVGLDDHAAAVRPAMSETVSVGPPIASFVCDSGGEWPRVEVATRRHRSVTDAVRCTSPALETAIDHIGGGSLWFGLIPTWAGPAKIEVEHRGGDREATTANIESEVRYDGGEWRARTGTSDAVGALRDGGVDGFPWTSTDGIAAPRSGRYEFRAVIHAVVETGSVVHLRNVQLVVTTIEGDLPGCGLARAPKDCPLARRLGAWSDPVAPAAHQGAEDGSPHAGPRQRKIVPAAPTAHRSSGVGPPTSLSTAPGAMERIVKVEPSLAWPTRPSPATQSSSPTAWIDVHAVLPFIAPPLSEWRTS